MKSITALTTATATLATTLIAGAIFFAPQASTAQFGPDNKPGQISVYVHDDEKDPIDKVNVLVTDVNGSKPVQVDTQPSGADGRLQVKFPRGGTYIVHIDAPPDPKQYGEGNDTDGTTTFQCMSTKEVRRCITVQVSNGVVHFPGETSGVPAKELDMWFTDRIPEPRIEVFVQLVGNAQVLIPGERSLSPPTSTNRRPTTTPSR